MPALPFLPNIWKPASIVAGVLLAVALAWGFRVDTLRAGYKHQLDTIRIVLENVGEKVSGYEGIPVAVAKIDIDRKRHRTERDQERAANEVMASSVKRMGAETATALQQAEDAQRRVAQLTKERDGWIARARNAATRTERMTAEQEAAQCTEELTDLWRQGF